MATACRCDATTGRLWHWSKWHYVCVCAFVTATVCRCKEMTVCDLSLCLFLPQCNLWDSDRQGGRWCGPCLAKLLNVDLFLSLSFVCFFFATDSSWCFAISVWQLWWRSFCAPWQHVPTYNQCWRIVSWPGWRGRQFVQHDRHPETGRWQLVFGCEWWSSCLHPFPWLWHFPTDRDWKIKGTNLVSRELLHSKLSTWMETKMMKSERGFLAA